jgi:hypothetical protein
VWRANTHAADLARFSCSLSCSPVLADQAAENLTALDPGSDIDGAARLLRRILPQDLMRAMVGLVAGELRQDRSEMPFAEDQDGIQALTDLHGVHVAKPLNSGGGTVDACYLRSQVGDLERSIGQQGDYVGVGESAQHA